MDLMPLETYSFDCESIYDDSGVDYLYTKVSMVVRCVVNGFVAVTNGPFMSYNWAPGSATTTLSTANQAIRPGTKEQLRGANANSSDPDGPSRRVAAVPFFGAAPGGLAAGGAGTTPNAAGIDLQTVSPLRGIQIVPSPTPVTHGVVRHRLSTPRGQLWVFSGPGMESGSPAAGTFGEPTGVVLLQSPSPPNPLGPTPAGSPPGSGTPGYPCDCKNGPFPKLFGIHTALGDMNTLLVDWGCETYINEAESNQVNLAGALLSNRFRQTHTVSDDGYTVVKTEGSAIFRTDYVYDPTTGIVNPDTFRALLFMPIQQGFVRENIVVVGREDVTGVDYSYEDRQVPVNFVAGPFMNAASIEAIHRQVVTSDVDLLDSAITMYERVLSIKANREFANPRNPRKKRKKKKGL